VGDIVLGIIRHNLPADHVAGTVFIGGNGGGVYIVVGRSVVMKSVIEHRYAVTAA
jgi:hypothetical protein